MHVPPALKPGVLVPLIVCALSVATAAAQPTALWHDVDEKVMLAAKTRAATDAHRNVVPQVYRTVGLDRSGLEKMLAGAAPEFSSPADVPGVAVELPLPGGGTGRFIVQESPVMDPELAAKYPEIKTYIVQGIDDPTASGRIDLTPRG